MIEATVLIRVIAMSSPGGDQVRVDGSRECWFCRHHTLHLEFEVGEVFRAVIKPPVSQHFPGQIPHVVHSHGRNFVEGKLEDLLFNLR